MARQTEDGAVIGPLSVRADAGEVAEFAAALGLQLAPGTVPLTYPIRWLALPAVREAIERAVGAPYPVHRSQSFQFDAALASDRDYSLRVTIRQDRTPSPRVVVNGTLCDQDDCTVLRLETVLYPTIVLAASTPPHQYAAKHSALPEIDIGPVSMAQTERYAAAAHDYNRLHYDTDVARAVGLDGPIVHGMMMMGLLQQALSMWCPGRRISRLYAMFARPVALGSRLSIGGRIMPHTEKNRIARLFVRTDRQLIACIGEAVIESDLSSKLPKV